MEVVSTGAPQHDVRSPFSPSGQLTGRTPRDAQESLVVTITFQVHLAHAPALRSAVEDISNDIGTRLEGQGTFEAEHALTKAAVAMGELRAAVNRVVPFGDPFYVPRGRR